MRASTVAAAALLALAALSGCDKKCVCTLPSGGAGYSTSPRISTVELEISESECDRKDAEYAVRTGGHCEYKTVWSSVPTEPEPLPD